jgi:hypothetical protein
MLVIIFAVKGYDADTFGTLTDWLGVILLGATLWQAKSYFDREHAAVFVVKHDQVKAPKPNGFRVNPTSNSATITVDPPKEWPDSGMNVWCENVGDIKGYITFLGISMDNPENKELQTLDLFMSPHISKTEKVTPGEQSSRITLTTESIRNYFHLDAGVQYSYYSIYQAENKKIYWDEFQLTS